MCYGTTMPSLVVIGQQIKEKQRGGDTMLFPVPAEGLPAPPSADTGYLFQNWSHYLQNGSYFPPEAQIIRIAAHMRIAPASPSVIAIVGESGLMFTNRSHVYKYRPSQNRPCLQSQWR